MSASCCFASLGVALSHVIPNFDSAPAYVNAVFLPMIFISGVFYDADDAPPFLRDIAEVLPLKHLIDGLSGAMVATGEGVAGNGLALLVLGIWTAGCSGRRHPRLLVGGAAGVGAVAVPQRRTLSRAGRPGCGPPRRSGRAARPRT